MNVPKLRFKEFNDKWKPINLANTFQYFSTNSFSREQLSESGILKNLHYGDIHRKYNSIVNENKDITSYIKDINYVNKYELLKNNDLIFADASEDYEGIGKAVEVVNVNNNTVSGLHTILARDNSNVFAPMFKGYYFNSPIVHNQVRILANGFKVYGISRDSINKLNIRIPSIQEQSKIANTLYLLDKKIELQTKKIEDLKLFKKGLINILNKKSYQETTLGKIGKFQTSSIDKLVKENEKIVNLYNYMDVYKHKIIMTQDLSKLSKTSAKDNQIITNNLKRGDILFTPSSETPDDIGHSICIQENLPNTVYSYHLLRYRPNIIIDPLFSNYYFNNSKIRKQIIRYATGATRYTVSLDNFLKIKVDIPDLITQKKYGLLLYSTDKKVNKEMFKLNKLQELKKGLMQDMFV